MPSTYLSKTGSGSGATTCTFSAWVKRSELQVTSGSPQCIWGWQNVSNSDRIVFHFNNGGSEDFRVYIQNSAGSATEMILATNRQFRDVNCWYHIVIEIDTTQATTSDRAKLYVNGVQETSFSTATYPTQNYVLKYMSSTGNTAVGNNGVYTYPYSGLLSHVYYIDGTAYDVSTFGEFDANGVWKPKADVSVTYGTNGFFLKMENSGSMGTDSSGNANNFTVNGTLTQTVDTPSNVYCTGNPLNLDGTGVTTLINGNLTHNNNVAATGTLAVNKGKWYYEVKRQDNGGTITNWMYVGFRPIDRSYGTTRVYRSSNGDYYNGSAYVSYGASWGDGDILGIALDYDNDTIEFYKNGVSQGSQTSTGLCDGTLVTPIWQCSQASGSPYLHANFGNGYFGTTAVASAGSNGNGSIFEYDVPSGYYALNTKNLATYG